MAKIGYGKLKPTHGAQEECTLEVPSDQEAPIFSTFIFLHHTLVSQNVALAILCKNWEYLSLSKIEAIFTSQSQITIPSPSFRCARPYPTEMHILHDGFRRNFDLLLPVSRNKCNFWKKCPSLPSAILRPKHSVTSKEAFDKLCLIMKADQNPAQNNSVGGAFNDKNAVVSLGPTHGG